MNARGGNMASTGQWAPLVPGFDEAPGARASLGIVALATDRAGVKDFETSLDKVAGVGVFATRVPMATLVTPDALRAMHGHLAEAAGLLVPGSRLDAVAFSCTSGTVAIGLERVSEAFAAARPGVPVTTPVSAAAVALQALGARRITLMAPYRPETADLVAGFFEAAGFHLDHRATFGLDGDPDMNRLSATAICSAAETTMSPGSDALFISCTGLRTAGLVADLESVLGRPVLTSNQVLAWHALRLAGIADQFAGRGRLFSDA